MLAALILAESPASAQEPTDCIRAIGVCSNGIVSESSNGPGINDFASPNNSQGCLSALEHQSVWLFIKVASGTSLGFDITPVEGAGEDYDFAVYGPNKSCDNMGSPIRCSWADAYCDYCPSTGLNSIANDHSEGSIGDGYVRWLNVNPGETYYILVDNYNTSSAGFDLTWTGNADLDCSVTQPCPELDLGNDVSYCEGSTTTIGTLYDPALTYLWNTGETTSEISISTPGTFWMDATKDGCMVRDSIQVFEEANFTIELGLDTTLCLGDALVLNAQHSNIVNYLWQDATSHSTLSVTSSGTYSVFATNGSCQDTDTIHISFEETPQFDLGADITVCEGQPILLDATSPFATSYEWQDGSTNTTFEVAQTGLFIATASNAGCSFTDQIQVEVIAFDQPFLGNDTMMCTGQTLVLDVSSPSATSFLWSDGSTASVLEITMTGEYWVEVTNDNCVLRDTIVVNVYPMPSFDLGPDRSICEGEMLLLDATTTPSSDYFWQDGSTGSTFFVEQSGVYAAVASNPGCVYTDHVFIEVLETPQLDLGPDTTLCDGEVLILDVSNAGASTYLWEDGSTSSSYVINSSGTYSLVASNGTCYATDDIAVVFHKVPVFDLAMDSSMQQVPVLFCEGDDFLLTAYSPHALGYLWHDGSVGSTYMANMTGQYSVTAYNNSCSYTDNIVLTFNPKPSVDLGNDTSICEGSTLLYNVSSSIATGYIWQDGSTEPEYQIDESGTYEVMVVANQCIATDVVSVEVLQAPAIDLGVDTTICEGTPYILNAHSIAATNYLWQDGTTIPSITVNQTGQYAVTVSNGMCAVTDQIWVDFYDAPNFDLGQDLTICRSEDHVLNAPLIEGATYTWQDNSHTPSIQINEEGIYTLTIETACGVSSDDIRITLENCGCNIVFPTAFTPNGDGHNDTFYPLIACDELVEYELEIYNRWGELLFRSDDMNDAWLNAIGDVNVLELDTYIWAVNYSWVLDGEKYSTSESGSVLLLK